MSSDSIVVIPESHVSNYFKTLQQEIVELKNLIQQSKQPPIDRLITEDELSIILGVCQRTVTNRLKNRELEYSEIKGKRYVRSSALDQYIQRHTVPKKQN